MAGLHARGGPVPAALFPEAPSENRLRVLVTGRFGDSIRISPSGNTYTVPESPLPEVLRRLADLGLVPLSARLHRHDDGTASLPLELEPQGPAGAERIARGLSALPGVRHVAYQEAAGGGLFSREAVAVAAE